MATTRTIRRVNNHYQHDFDEQLWPVNIALLVLCGFVGGLIVTYSNFDWDATHWYQNGWVRLASLVITVGLFIGAAAWLGGQSGRRFQFAAVISILVHAFAGWQLALYSLDSTPAVATAKAEPTPAIIEFEYRPDVYSDNAPQQDFEKPIETRPEQVPTKLTERVVKQPQPNKVQTLPVPDQVQPTPLETAQTPIAKPELAVPKREPTQSKLSRADIQSPPTPTLAKPVENVTPKVTAPQEQLVAQATPRERTAETPKVNPQATNLPNTASTATPTQVAIAQPRPTPATETPNTARPAQLPRANTTPQETPRNTTVANTPAPAKAADAATLTAATNNTSKSSSGPQTKQPEVARDTTANEVPSPAPAPSRSAPRPDSNSLARNDSPAAPARESRTASTTTNTAQAEQVASTTANNSAAASSGLTAQATQTQRTTSSATVANNAVALNSNEQTSNNSPTPSTATTSKATSNEVASASTATTKAPAGLSSRPAAKSQAQALAESIQLPSLAATSGSGEQGLSGPTSANTTSRNSQVPGQSQSANLESNWADGATNPQAAGTASASKATTTEAGDATAAARDSIARNQSANAGSVAASTTQATDVANPTNFGGATAAELNASANASQRANSSAAIGPLATAIGSAASDTGEPNLTSTQPAASRGAAGSNTTNEPAAGRTAPQRDVQGSAATTNGNTQASDIQVAASGAGQAANAAALTAGSAGGSRTARTGPNTGGPQLSDASESGSGSATPTGIASVANANRDTGVGTPGAATAKSIGRANNSGANSSETTANDVAAPNSSGNQGQSKDPQLAASSAGTGRASSGLPGPTINSPIGANNGEATDGFPGPVAGANLGPSANRLESAIQGTGPAVPSAGNLARAVGNAPGTGEAPIDTPSLPNVGQSSAPNVGPSLQASSLTGTSGASRQAVNVQVAVASDSGGFSDHYTERVGSLLPQAREESSVRQTTPARFLNRTAAGATAVDGQVREAAPAFRKRNRTSNLEREIELGLEFVSKAQLKDGSWSLQNYPGAKSDPVAKIQSSTAATGLSLLAFLGAGYDHFGEQYQPQVEAGLKYLVQNQKPNGDLYVPQFLSQTLANGQITLVADDYSNNCAQFYSHGIATIALCEAYGMTGDEKLREPAQRAIQFIEKSQHPQLGGWRYKPGNTADGSDTSVTGWQLMALKSGELAKLQVQPATYAGVRRWLDTAQIRQSNGSLDRAQYAYNPQASELQRQGRLATAPTNSMGLLMRMYLGWDRQNPDLQRGAEQLLANLPENVAGKRNTYYWYYASQVMYHMQGEAWEKWNARLRPMLLNSQIKQGTSAGSWEPNGPVPDRWGEFGGRLYVTTMNLLSLEVTHRYLPIYETISEKK